jgi:biopolymer transport protein TolR
LRRNKKTDVIGEITVTNLVDVALTILTIFIITAPMMTPGIDVNLPRTDASLPHDQEGITVSINRGRDIYIDTDRVTLDNFQAKMETILKNKTPGVTVYIRADKSLDYGFVIDLVGRMRKAGVKALGLVAEIPEK